ncbi:MAG TPA: FkbM family methyltransferase [Thermoanaerobaculia bacterium]|nr:FkbM family methyltransferase [Thermoanaerobaculia bacterium]
MPRESRYLYRLSKKYVDRYRNENNGDMRSNGEERFLASVLPACRVVFDVGANVGDWAKIALSVNPRVNLHCFEPSHATYARLVASRFPPNVLCNNIGLGSTPSEGRLLIFEDGSGLNSLYRREGLEAGWGIDTNTREESIQLDTLDNYVESQGITSRIDLCKIDVEGHELEVLRGMKATLGRRQMGMIQFEYGGCNIDSRVLLKDIFSFLHGFKYELFKIWPAELRHVPKYDQRLENFQYQNWVAKPTI